MSQMNDVEEFAICSDIASRMAIFAMAKSCTEEEINMAFNVINEALINEGGYDQDKVSSLTKQYKDGTIMLRKGLNEGI